MAVTNEKANEIVGPGGQPLIMNAITKNPRVHRKVFTFTQGAAAGDANSTVDLAQMQPGRVRIFTASSRVATSAFGAARVLNIGHTGYSDLNGTAVAADVDAFHSAADVSAVGAFAPTDEQATGMVEIVSRTGFLIQAQVTGGTIPAGATINGWFDYGVD